ncbi:MAG: hypothetical protein L3J96_07380, partial [Thermoplasmata archaeon]|nr:hypothetical protein [Thermoplasmata archaeon]
MASLSVAATPASICAFGYTGCPAGTGEARVNLSAIVEKSPDWANVQVAFVLDTTPFMGVLDTTKGNVSEESNGVPVLVHNATEIANAIQSAHPHSNVSFALVDYFS